MKKMCLACGLLLASAYQVNAAQEWHAAAFGQSTDLNFSSLVKPEKIGLNNVWIAGEKNMLSQNQAYALPSDFFIESRGGKIANSHDGMTVFYTQLPATQTFTLEADVTLLQIGPEVDNKSPAAQEGAGLFIRDIVGTPRQEPQTAGFEEFPNASNMVMNTFITQNKKNDNLVQITALIREGVKQPFGNDGITIEKKAIAKNLNYLEHKDLHLSIERTPTQLILTMKDNQTGELKSYSLNDYDGFFNQQDKDSIYAGFFASRNAKMEVKNAQLILNPEQVNYSTLPAKIVQTKETAPQLLLASPSKVATAHSVVQFKATINGKVTLQPGNLTKDVIAGELVQFPVELQKGNNEFTLTYQTEANQQQQTVNIDYVETNIADLSAIYVAEKGQANATGTAADPVDLKTALEFVVPNGTIYLANGHYEGVTLPQALSGLPNQPKTIIAQEKHQAIFINETFNLDADYWQLKNVVFDGNIENPKDNTKNKPAYLRIAGSHNIIDQAIARNNLDSGIAITAKSKNRLFWPAYNHIINSDSYNNLDLSGINADGFSAKLGVGKGNKFSGCISHHNADDGYDLFNKIEDGANEVVVIENSISYANGRPFSKPDVAYGSIGNGFKLGGEGQPVNHKIINSIAFDNNMDGFTDNFNTGSLIVENNIALNSARYNYILRSNPYEHLTSSILFEGNYSIRNSWENAIKDYLGTQVKNIQSKTLTAKKAFGKDISIQEIKRDENGNIIYPTEFLKLNPNLGKKIDLTHSDTIN